MSTQFSASSSDISISDSIHSTGLSQAIFEINIQSQNSCSDLYQTNSYEHNIPRARQQNLQKNSSSSIVDTDPLGDNAQDAMQSTTASSSSVDATSQHSITQNISSSQESTASASVNLNLRGERSVCELPVSYEDVQHGAQMPLCGVVGCHCANPDYFIPASTNSQSAVACPLCDHGRKVFISQSKLLKHVRDGAHGGGCTADPRAWKLCCKRLVPGSKWCGDCDKPYMKLGAQHRRFCTGRPAVEQPTEERTIAQNVVLAYEAANVDVDAMDRAIPNSILMHERKTSRVKHTGAVRRGFAHVFGSIVDNMQVVAERESALHPDERTEGASKLLLVFSALMKARDFKSKNSYCTPAVARASLRMFVSNRWDEIKSELVSAYVVRAPNHARKSKEESVAATARAVDHLVSSELLSQAYGRTSSMVEPVSMNDVRRAKLDEYMKLGEQGPAIRAMRVYEGRSYEPVGIKSKHSRDAVYTAPKGKAGSSVDGLNREDLLAVEGKSLAKLFNLMAENLLPPTFMELVAGGKLTLLSKPDSANPDAEFRPILPQSCLYRYAARAMINCKGKLMSKAIGDNAFAFRVKGGTEQIALNAALHLDMHDGHVLLMSDFKNGYYTVKREIMREIIMEKVPFCLGMFDAAYGQANVMSYVVEGGEIQYGFLVDGIVQGDPLAPMYFSLLNADVRKTNNELSTVLDPCSHDEFLDDGIFLGEASKVVTMFCNTVESAKKWGGELKQGKVVLYATNIWEIFEADGSLRSIWSELQEKIGFEIDFRFPGIPAVVVDGVTKRYDGITVLGRPQGSKEYCEWAIRRSLSKKTVRDEVFSRVKRQNRLLMTRFCASPRLQPVTRSCSYQMPELWSEVDNKMFGEEGMFFKQVLGIRKGAYSSEGLEIAVLRAQISLRDNGVGLLTATDLAATSPVPAWGAYFASGKFKNSHLAPAVREVVADGDYIPCLDFLKTLVSDYMSGELGQYLLANDVSAREVPRCLADIIDEDNTISQDDFGKRMSKIRVLKFAAKYKNNVRVDLATRAMGTGSRLLLDALPTVNKLSIEDGLFRELMIDYVMLEDKRFTEDLLCPDCNKELTRTHALSCMKSGRRYKWHNACQRAVMDFGRDTMLQPTKKQPSELDYGFNKERADVHFSGHRFSRDATIDVTTCVHNAPTNVKFSIFGNGKLVQKKQQMKHDKYGPAAGDAERDFFGPCQNDKGRVSSDMTKLWKYGVKNFEELDIQDNWHLDRKVYNRYRSHEPFEKGSWSSSNIGLYNALMFGVQTAKARQRIVEDVLRNAKRKRAASF